LGGDWKEEELMNWKERLAGEFGLNTLRIDTDDGGEETHFSNYNMYI